MFADDGEPAADAAWSWIISHDWHGWRLHVITVHETLVPGGPAFGHARHVDRRPPAEARFSMWDHADAEGDARTALLGCHDVSMMIVGCHHRGHLSGLWAGSTTEWLIVGTPFPLLVARHGHASRSVALCVDGSTHAQRALEVYLSLPWMIDAQATLLSVDDGTIDVETALTRSAAAFGRRRAPALMRLAGQAQRAIPEYVRDNQIDLVVVGTRGLKGLKRMVIGSTVSALLKDATANLLIAHVQQPDQA